MSGPTNLDPKQYQPAVDLLKQIDFLAGLTDSDLMAILPDIQYQKFIPNHKILRQGIISNRLFIVCRGSVEISVKSQGEKLVLAELSPPQYFGEISLLTPTAATATVTSIGEGANVLILTNESLTALKSKIPDIQDRIKKVIDKRNADREAAKKAKSEEDEFPEESENPS